MLCQIWRYQFILQTFGQAGLWKLTQNVFDTVLAYFFIKTNYFSQVLFSKKMFQKVDCYEGVIPGPSVGKELNAAFIESIQKQENLQP